MTQEERFPFQQITTGSNILDEEKFEVCVTCGAIVPARTVLAFIAELSINALEKHHEWHLAKGE